MFKSELRLKYLTKRNLLTEKEIDSKSHMIIDLIFSKFKLKNKVISLFLPIKSKNEINTFYLWEQLQKIKTIVTVPKTIFETNDLIHFELKALDQLILNKYNIPEPLSGNIFHEEQFDYVFIPLLTIDKHGNRVGYGKGFYDRFLSKCKNECVFIGLYLFDEIEIIDDLNEFDFPLNYCVTPNQIIEFSRN